MIEVYFYVPLKEVNTVVECGLKLSKWFEKEVLINGESKKCITAFLNPKDGIKKYKSPDLKCIKIEIDSKYCFIADKFLYRVGLDFPKAMEMYTQSIIPVEKYTFGSYRLPECLITSTVIMGQISVLDKWMDSPILFDNSEELYMNNVIETYKEDYSDFNDAMLYALFCKLSENGKVYKIEDVKKGIAVFFHMEKGKTFTIRIPDMKQY